jgi:NAD(P)H-dependent FMN reductase
MSEPALRILAIPGSLRRGSHSRHLLDVAGSVADGASYDVLETLADIPPYSEDHEGDETPGPVLAFRAAIGAADALVISTPEYNGSIPGQLKNALDWASRPYGLSEIVGKPVALISSSPSPFGGTWALADLRKVLERSGAAPIESSVSVGKVHEERDSEAVADQLRALVSALVLASQESLELA